MSMLKDFIKKAWRWEEGRQQSGYDKMLLLWGLFPLPFDMYIIRYKIGSCITPHVDKVTSGEHYRINIVLQKATEGGDFVCESCILNTERIKIFRPDKYSHSVTEIKSGMRYILSVGWIKNK